MAVKVKNRKPTSLFRNLSGISWETKELGECCDLISGSHLSPDSYNNLGKGIPYFTGPTDYTNTIGEVEKWTDKRTAFAKPNDILITVKGSGVGKLHFLKFNDVAIGRQIMALRANKDYDSAFIFHCLAQKAG